MKKYFILILSLAAALAGCRNMEVDLVDGRPTSDMRPKDSLCMLTVQAFKGDGPLTKGLEIGEGTDEATTTALKSIWKEGETVYVYLGTDFLGTLTVTPDAKDPHKATLSGEVTGKDITPGETRIYLLTPRNPWFYTRQNGKLLVADNESSSIESLFHYTLADVLVTGKEAVSTAYNAPYTLTTERATFENQQSIYRLSFRFQKNGQDTKTPITAESVVISGAGDGLVQAVLFSGNIYTGDIDLKVIPATSDPVFAALRFASTTEDEDLQFKVIDADGVTYYGSKTIPAQYKANGNFISIKNTTLDTRLSIPKQTASTATAL